MSTLKDEIDAIEYDHWMLLETGRILREREDTLPVVEWNAFVESHVTHLRCLAEFLFRKTDGALIQARHSSFGANWHEEWPDGMYDAVFRRASEEVAHLSHGRLLNQKTNWLPAFAETVDTHFQRWLAAASDDVRRLFVKAQERHLALFQIAADSPIDRGRAISTSSTNSRIIGL